jgi:toluene monooxygenase system protein E
MTQAKPRDRGKSLKTWSALGNLGRRPTEYEILTHNLNHTVDGLEMGPDSNYNDWLREYRDSGQLRVADWDAFRDPDAQTYGTYVLEQDNQETYVEGLLEQADRDSYDNGLSADALRLFANAVAPSRYLSHGLQMLSAYVQQLAFSSYVANCAVFQTADQLRRVQTTSYRTTQVSMVDRSYGIGSRERAQWESHPTWQPIRRAVERALTEFAWERAFVVTNLVVKPVTDYLTLAQLGRQADVVGASLDSLLLENLYRDSLRSQRWTKAFVDFVAQQDPNNLAVLQRHLTGFASLGTAIIDGSVELLVVPNGPSREVLASDLRTHWRGLLDAVQLQV